jgi:membrane-bound hydrogenase subunit mbhJ
MLKKLCKKAFPKALWVYHANTGACNGCDIEVIDVLTPYYDVERFGIRLVGSPRHADVLLVCGPVTRQVATCIKETGGGSPESQADLCDRILRHRSRYVVRYLQHSRGG